MLLKDVASYFVQREPRVPKNAPRPQPSKKIKTQYVPRDVVKELYADRIKAKTSELFAQGGYKLHMNASKHALQAVEKELTEEEKARAAAILEEWNSGNIVSETSRRL